MFICTLSAPAVLVRKLKPLPGCVVLQDFLSLQGEWHTVTRGRGAHGGPVSCNWHHSCEGQRVRGPPEGSSWAPVPSRGLAWAMCSACPSGLPDWGAGCSAWPTLPRAGPALSKVTCRAGTWASGSRCRLVPLGRREGGGHMCPARGGVCPPPVPLGALCRQGGLAGGGECPVVTEGRELGQRASAWQAVDRCGTRPKGW